MEKIKRVILCFDWKTIAVLIFTVLAAIVLCGEFVLFLNECPWENEILLFSALFVAGLFIDTFIAISIIVCRTSRMEK